MGDWNWEERCPSKSCRVKEGASRKGTDVSAMISSIPGVHAVRFKFALHAGMRGRLFEWVRSASLVGRKGVSFQVS